MKLIKKITIEVLTPDNKRVLQRVLLRPPRGKRFFETGAEKATKDFMQRFDQLNAGRDYRLVEFAGNTFKIVNGGN
jgi:hypothetical protein